MSAYNDLELNKRYLKYKMLDRFSDCYGKDYGRFDFCKVCEFAIDCNVQTKERTEKNKNDQFSPQQIKWLDEYIALKVAELVPGIVFDIFDKIEEASAELEKGDPS